MTITHHRQTAGRYDPPVWNLHGLTVADMTVLASGVAGIPFSAMARDALDELAAEQRRDTLIDAVMAHLPLVGDDVSATAWSAPQILTAIRQAWFEAFPLDDHEANLAADPQGVAAVVVDMHADDAEQPSPAEPVVVRTTVGVLTGERA